MIDFNAPKEPGVYLFKSNSGKILYVGKAKDLHARLSHYKTPERGSKTEHLMREARGLEYIACRNETEALVLENTLIKQHQPPYNIMLKDNSQYAYLKFTDEEFPRLLTVRKRDARRNEKLLGPFVSGRGRSVAAYEVRRMFGLRICDPLPKKECLQYHMGFCTAPCIGKINSQEYAQNVKRAARVLTGHTEQVEDALKAEMDAASQRLDYERALELRERLNALARIKDRQLMETQRMGNEDYFGFVQDGEKLRCCVLNSRDGLIVNKDYFTVQAIGESAISQILLRYYDDRALPHKLYARLENPQEEAGVAQILAERQCQLVVPQRGDKLELLKLAEKNTALAIDVDGVTNETLALQRALGLSRPPKVIDCFDVSNLAGKQNVGSCVRFTDGKAEKSSYRRFMIRTVTGQDDFASMKEIVYRRYRGAVEKNERMPDLVLIDGGPGQLHAAMAALGELGIELSLATLAKKEEEVYLPELQQPLQLNRRGEALKLLQRCRDEAHRFAITYNRRRRKMESEF